MVNFVQSLACFKSCCGDLLTRRSIERMSREMNYRWRDGKLPPDATVHCMMEQMVHGNVSCTQVRQLRCGQFSAEAFCQARQRLPLALLERLNQTVSAAVMKVAVAIKPVESSGINRHRVFILDGSGFSMPDTPELVEHFGLRRNQREGCGYPTCHLLLQTGPGGVVTAAICSPYRTGDMTHIQEMQQTLRKNDLVLGDRLFSNWGHLCLLHERGAHGLFRMHHSRKALFGKHKDYGSSRQFVKKLGHKDQLMKYLKPSQKPAWMSREQFTAMPRWILVREFQVKVKIGRQRRTVTLITTLIDVEKYPAKQLVPLLAERWQIETNLRHLKTTMGLNQVRCKTVDGVKKELQAYLLSYNIVRLVMLKAAQRQKVSVSRISFTDALSWLKHHRQTSGLIDLMINPKRERRIEPRVIKRRKPSFPYMSQPRKALRLEIVQKSLAA